MAWSGSTRRSRLPPGWSSTIQPRILARDGYRCYVCCGPATEVDHKQPGDDHSDANLGAICTPCHKRKTVEERPLLRRPTVRHPGLR